MNNFVNSYGLLLFCFGFGFLVFIKIKTWADREDAAENDKFSWAYRDPRGVWLQLIKNRND
jgi:hypothetical protein